MNNNTPSQIGTEVNTIVQMARPIFASVSTSPGDFSNRLIDTRTTKIPTRGDIVNISSAESPIGRSQQKRGVIKQNCWNVIKLFRWRVSELYEK